MTKGLLKSKIGLSNLTELYCNSWQHQCVKKKGGSRVGLRMLRYQYAKQLIEIYGIYGKRCLSKE